MKIILASASPRRYELLKSLINEFTVEPSQVDEGSMHKTPTMMTLDVARKKGRAVYAAHQNDRDALIISADTTVYCNGKIYGKPKDEADAAKIISSLNGKWHTVYTAVSVIFRRKVVTFVEKSAVKFKSLTENQIKTYVDEYKPLDKAGAYGIQNGVVVETFKGSESNIIGLPVEKLGKKLKALEKRCNVKILD